MEASIITKTNAMKAAQFLLNLDASYVNDRYQKIAHQWVQNMIKAKCVLEQCQYANSAKNDLTKSVVENKLSELTDHAKDLSRMLTEEAQEKLINFLLINRAI